MKKAVVKFVLIYLVFVALFVVQKPVFMSVYFDRIDPGWLDWLAVPLHGLSMDLAVAGYLTVVPGLLIIAQLLTSRRWPRVAMRLYLGLAAAMISAVFCLDLVLYSYWGFRLDTTPFFYFSTSPSAAMASAPWWQTLCGAVGFLGVAVGVWWLFKATVDRVRVEKCRSWRAPMVLAFLTLLLILPIRGSLTVSTMNPSRAYFSPKRPLNHAATNPAFNLLYSATHQADFAGSYRFFEPEKARRLFGAMMACGGIQADTLRMVPSVGLKDPRPDVYIIVLESFSAHLMPSLGGHPVALGLDSLGREGVLFTRFYANSFRTDRALPSIFSALPGQPSTSILKYVDKIERLPSIPLAMKEAAGYQTAYYYGGDTNFTNMQAYLMAMGIDRVVSDRDFTMAQRASKWGAPDHLLFQKALAEATARPVGERQPQLMVIQTSSSHEPFEVPYANPRFVGNAPANAFAYTDSCLTAFVGGLKQAGKWDNSLLVVVPDHYGCWPAGLPSMPERHHVPLVLAGGALDAAPGTRIDTPATQADIAATLLGLLGIDSSAFQFSRDILAPGGTAPVAVFTEAGAVAVVTPRGYVELDPDSDTVGGHSGLDNAAVARDADLGRAWLQVLYGYIDSL